MMLIAGTEVNVKLFGQFHIFFPINKLRKSKKNYITLALKQVNMLTKEEDSFS